MFEEKVFVFNLLLIIVKLRKAILKVYFFPKMIFFTALINIVTSLFLTLSL